VIKPVSTRVVAIRGQISRHYQLISFARLQLAAADGGRREESDGARSADHRRPSRGFIRRRPADRVTRPTFDDSATPQSADDRGGRAGHHHDSNVVGGLVDGLLGVER